MIRHLLLAAYTTAGAFVLAVSIFVLMTVNGFACQMVTASFYGLESCKPHRPCVTASGERFTGADMTAASLTLPLGSRVIVRNVQNGQSVQVRINDRGPYIRGRSIDLSRAAASRIGLTRAGVGRVCLEQLG
jgi:rare lipoprotein A